MPFGGITDDEMRAMAAELAARVADTGDPFSGDDWRLFQLAKAVPALMDVNTDLLAALKEVVERCESGGGSPGLLVLARARAIIAKAEGGAA